MPRAKPPAARGRRAPDLATVVIPVRDGERWIADQLEALAGQEYGGAWEVVVADNGSRDDSARVARSFAEQLPALRVVDAGARRGINHARNAGAGAARGDLLLFCDADDVVCAGWLGEMVEAAGDADLVGGRLRWDLLNDELASSWRPKGEMTKLSATHGFLPYPAGGNLAVWADVARALGWDERFTYASSDQEFGWRAQLSGYAVAYAPQAIVEQRLRGRLGAIAWQQLLHGISGPKLVRAFDPHGLPRPENRAALERWRWLLTHVSHLWESPALRGQWVRRAAFRLGRLVGSARYRTICL